ncbi:MAG: galactokinase [Acidimicrobiia bacterium]|nr:galactokinase [Acidimicrobiia bacterium]
MIDPELARKAVQSWEQAGGHGDPVLVAAPGRVNILGEHTDYNGGLCLPTAADLHVMVAAAGAECGLVVAERDERFEVALETPLDDVDGNAPGWGRLALALVHDLRRQGRPEKGMVAGVDADLPQAAGMSSSAAYVIALCLALAETAGWAIGPDSVISAAQHAERDAFGVPCGVLDQTTIVHAEAGRALFLDCRTRAFAPVELPEDVALVVADSGIYRRLSESGYEDRVRECTDAARRLGVACLRDVGPGDLDAARRRLPHMLFRRVRHVVTENARVEAAVGASTPTLGALVTASHASLRDDFEVSLPAIDDLVEQVTGLGGVCGARIMGAGFGGSVLVVCERPAAGHIRDEISDITGRPAWLTEPVAGARVLDRPPPKS